MARKRQTSTPASTVPGNQPASPPPTKPPSPPPSAPAPPAVAESAPHVLVNIDEEGWTAVTSKKPPPPPSTPVAGPSQLPIQPARGKPMTSKFIPGVTKLAGRGIPMKLPNSRETLHTLYHALGASTLEDPLVGFNYDHKSKDPAEIMQVLLVAQRAAKIIGAKTVMLRSGPHKCQHRYDPDTSLRLSRTTAKGKEVPDMAPADYHITASMGPSMEYQMIQGHIFLEEVRGEWQMMQNPANRRYVEAG
ncbi:hypothetical protein B0T22DRAFT_485612 [Podospora appendiculata]|uniref:Uncharacterized protein n=1 Tax=Podospora appendiculata TaxID=314037 RepID=A0AAE0WYN8_9PEZI|nr:hypothetical protein B0T22DRAFT_485612 [Podospora appendiculata]